MTRDEWRVKHSRVNHRPGRLGPIPGNCKGCGCPWDEERPGCYNCQARHRERRRRVEVKAGTYTGRPLEPAPRAIEEAFYGY